MRRRFAAGEIVFQQGDPSECVVLVRSGRVEVLRAAGAEAILLGTAGDGEFIGEMGVLEARPRSATVRAATDLEVELIGRGAFLERVSRDPALAHKLLTRMSSRLRQIEDLLAQVYTRGRAEHEQLPAPDPRPAIALHAASYAAKFYVGLEPILIERLPFTVGREPAATEVAAGASADLAIAEPEPYRLSRLHFVLQAENGGIWLRDLNSDLGTIVNGTPLGRDFPLDGLALRTGANSVVAGGRGSPFEFTLILA